MLSRAASINSADGEGISNRATREVETRFRRSAASRSAKSENSKVDLRRSASGERDAVVDGMGDVGIVGEVPLKSVGGRNRSRFVLRRSASGERRAVEDPRQGASPSEGRLTGIDVSLLCTIGGKNGPKFDFDRSLYEAFPSRDNGTRETLTDALVEANSRTRSALGFGMTERGAPRRA